MARGSFREAGTLQPGDKLEWHRNEAWGAGEIRRDDIAEAALAGWLQSDGFVGQYDHGTNRSLIVEFMTVTDAEHEWVSYYLDTRFPTIHRNDRQFETKARRSRRTSHPSVRREAARLRRPLGAAWPAVSTWSCRSSSSRRRCPSSPPTCAACSRPTDTCRSVRTLPSSDSIIISEKLVRGVQQLLAGSGSSRGSVARMIRGPTATTRGRSRSVRWPIVSASATRSGSSTGRRAASSPARSSFRRRPPATSSGSRSTASRISARWTSTTSRPRAVST